MKKIKEHIYKLLIAGIVLSIVWAAFFVSHFLKIINII